jgi:hypothetical protein
MMKKFLFVISISLVIVMMTKDIISTRNYGISDVLCSFFSKENFLQKMEKFKKLA